MAENTPSAATAPQDLIRAANEKVGWAIFNLGKGKTQAALTLMEKAQAILEQAENAAPKATEMTVAAVRYADALRDILDVTTGYIRPVGANEALTIITNIAQEALRG